MSKDPTDTNQASEDELRYVLRHTKVTAYAAGKPYVVNLATVIQKEDIDAIQAIIRTERAKLFEQIRSEAELYNVKSINGEMVKPNTGILAVPLEALTRLEQK